MPLCEGMNDNDFSKAVLTLPGERTDSHREQTAGKNVFVPIKDGCVNINIGCISVPGLIDTGASVSCISSKFVQKLQDNRVKISFRSSHTKVFLADGSCSHSRRKACVQIEVGGRKVQHHSLILTKLNRPIIVGSELLKRLGAVISFQPSIEPSTYSIRARRSFTLAPLNEITVRGALISHCGMNDTIGVTENLRRKREVPFLVKHALVQPRGEENVVPLTLFNSGHKSWKFRKGEILGLYSKRSVSDFVPLNTMYSQEEVSPTKQPIVDSIKAVLHHDPVQTTLRADHLC